MRSRVSRVMGLALILGSFCEFGLSSPVFAQTSPRLGTQRERFLRLLLQRQDQAIVSRLTLQEQLLAQRLKRLEEAESLTANPRLQRFEQATQTRSNQVTMRLSNPPPAPIAIRLTQQKRVLEQQQALIAARIQQLQRSLSVNPRRTAQIQAALARLEALQSRNSNQIQSIDRIVATPFVP